MKTDTAPELCSAQRLAYLGDAVFELLIREMVLADDPSAVDSLHQRTKSYVNAPAQRRMYFQIYETLNPEEQAVLRRGRNAKTSRKAKHAAMTDYQHATGLEALFGYLFIKGDFERLKDVFARCVAKE